jgi:microcystin degradation protein MlrC
MRVFAGALATETNTFGPMPTGIDSYRQLRRGEIPEGGTMFSAPLAVARRRATALGWTLSEGLVAEAMPSGTTTRMAYETLRDELLRDLRSALPVNIVLLGLHGAMVADGYDDCEGDLLMRVRKLVGPGTIIGAELDNHCHLSAAMVDNADWLVAFKEYPHTDIVDRAEELVELCWLQAQGKVKPTAAMVDCNVVVTMHTSRDPARSLVDKIKSMERMDGVVSISLAHGFAWGDVPDMGTKVLVYTDGDPAKAQAIAQKLADEVVTLRRDLAIPFVDVDAALDQALAFPGGPVVVADCSDNAGGGAASDSTFLLARIVERCIPEVAVGPVWDPVAVRIAFEAGLGAKLAMRIGGKIGPLSGQPLDLECTIKAIHPDMVMTGLANTPMPLGDCALVESNGIEIVLTTIRHQAMGVDMFTQLGCALDRKKLVVVKSAQHFYAQFSRIAKHVIYCSGPGSVALDFKSLSYTKIKRPRWPMDEVLA